MVVVPALAALRFDLSRFVGLMSLTDPPKAESYFWPRRNGAVVNAPRASEGTSVHASHETRRAGNLVMLRHSTYLRLCSLYATCHWMPG